MFWVFETNSSVAAKSKKMNIIAHFELCMQQEIWAPD